MLISYRQFYELLQHDDQILIKTDKERLNCHEWNNGHCTTRYEYQLISQILGCSANFPEAQ